MSITLEERVALLEAEQKSVNEKLRAMLLAMLEQWRVTDELYAVVEESVVAAPLTGNTFPSHLN